MENKSISPELKAEILKAQKNEITEHYIYTKLAESIKNNDTGEVLKKIARDEKNHYEFWKRYTGREVSPNRLKIFYYYWLSKIFGVTFGIKLMEQGEENAQFNYANIAKIIPGALEVEKDENAHEEQLIQLIKEEKLDYLGSVVLGLNDALVELTGALAGLTFAMQDSNLIALAGLITGIAASFSMAASEYLSTKSEDNNKDELKSSIYTGVAYLCTVSLLILPYLLLENHFAALPVTLAIALFIIFIFNYYISIAKDYSFKKRFSEMAFISLGVAAVSFGIGVLVRKLWGIEV
ncbi:MAG: VIT1/CCC1 transporter family protein [Bacteroidales bacterium]